MASDADKRTASRAPSKPGAVPPTDSIDRVLAGWNRTRPELPVDPVGVIARLLRVRGYIDHELEATFAEEGLSGPSFSVLATVTRLGDRVPQHVLMDELRLTSGTVSVRVDRLVDADLAVREPDPGDARGTLVSLTTAGRRLFERCAPVHLANEERLLAALTEEERATLGALLRKLLISFEGSRGLHGRLPYLGLTLAPAHTAIEMRRAVGLPERTGLLVRAVADDGATAGADIEPGDVIVAAGGRELRSIATLYAVLGEAAESGRLALRVARGTDEVEVDVELTSPPVAEAEPRDPPRRRRGEVAHTL